MRDLTRQLVRASIVLLCACCLTLPIVARAASAGTGAAQGIAATLQAQLLTLELLDANLGPLPSVSGSAPPDFNLTDSVASAGVSIPLVTSLSTGVINTQTQSNLAANSVSSTAAVDGLAFQILAGVLSLGADAVSSSVTASCVGGTPTFTGSTTIAGATISGLVGSPSIAVNPAPNTVLLDLLGIRIELNKQTITPTSMTVDAISISLSGVSVPLIATLGGDIYVSRSSVSMPDCTVAPPAEPDLAVNKSGPATTTVGVPFDYVISLDNVGSGPTTGTITVADTLAAGLTINSVTAGTDFSCPVVGQTVTCTRSTPIPAGALGVNVATINVTPSATGPISNTATVSGGGDTNPGNDTTTPVETTVIPAGTPDLAITLGAPAAATVGNPFDYVIYLSNVGTAPTSGTITVSDTIPAGATISSVTPGAGFVCPPPAGQVVTCTSSDPIAAGTTNQVAVTIQVVPTAPGPLSNSTASVSGGADTNPANDVAPPSTTSVATVSASAVANPDTGTVTSGLASVVVPSVVANDTMSGSPATLGPGGNSTVFPTGTWPSTFALDPNSGAVIYNGGPLPPSTIVLAYILCDSTETICSVPSEITLAVVQADATQPIPTLSQWGLMILSLLLAAGMFWQARRHPR